ncbi:hypothetical protein VB776_03480 [Arcicella sp. DC2W]|uniref:Uncharacterized protein n=1 Tax=Arcicella gelida TaxID=2984195 RepID=A0ABU5S0M0_9BACT|nr:hypothetical protein [Arcicella sp. DC2W]MEA5401964.1 hypothetical protein [Arcicella sp. DC2W]
MKNIELLKLEGKLQNQAIIDLLEHDTFLTKTQIDEIIEIGEDVLPDLRLIIEAYLENLDSLKEYSENLVPFFHITNFLSYLKDENAFDLMIRHIKSDFNVLSDIYEDSINDQLPLFCAMFPNRIKEVEEALYDRSITYANKDLLSDVFVKMAIIHDNEIVKQEAISVLLKYLEFLSIPENREGFAITEGEDISWINLDEHLAFLISDLYNLLGEDVATDYVKSLFEQDLVETNIFGDLDELLESKRESFDAYPDIYGVNEEWEELVEEQRQFEENRKRLEEENRLLQAQRMALLNQAEKFEKLYKQYNRNDKVSVKYEDGTILKDVKFKKIEEDLKNEKCSIIS